MIKVNPTKFKYYLSEMQKEKWRNILTHFEINFQNNDNQKKELSLTGLSFEAMISQQIKYFKQHIRVLTASQSDPNPEI